MKLAKILFFVDGNAPSPEDFLAASEMKATVMFRNARHVPSEPHSLEICDGVAGKVPAIYAEKFPTAEAAIASRDAALKALTSKVGDAPAPKQSVPAKDVKAPGKQAFPAAWTPNAPQA